MVYLWLVLMIVFLVLEALTVQMMSIWLAVGSLGALIAALCHAPYNVQAFVFLAVSALCLVATRPLVKKISKKHIQPTNADRCIGETAVVTEKIDNIAAKGQVNVKGAVWTARSEKGEIIPEGEIVKVLFIDGVKLIVEPIAVPAGAEKEKN